jgi:hypothetical protein
MRSLHYAAAWIILRPRVQRGLHAWCGGVFAHRSLGIVWEPLPAASPAAILYGSVLHAMRSVSASHGRGRHRDGFCTGLGVFHAMSTPEIRGRFMACNTALRLGTWAGRPIRAKTYGKKREHGLHSYDFGREAAVLFRYRREPPVYCVQSWRASRTGRNTAHVAGVLHATNRRLTRGMSLRAIQTPSARAGL